MSECEFPRYLQPLAPAKPFLMPSFNDEVVEILPSEKANRKIFFDEHILVQEIENRFAYMQYDEDEEDSYEIEIVEDDGDADFYLEIVDGEVFYVFETEDDISDSDSDDELVSESETSTDDEGPRGALQLPIGNMLAPNLDGDDESSDDDAGRLYTVKQHEQSHSTLNVPTPEELLAASDSETETPPESPQSVRKPAAPAPAMSAPLSPEQTPAQTVSSVGSPTPAPASEGYDSQEMHTPEAAPKESVTGRMVDMVPQSPIAGPIAPASPSVGNRTPVRSILKACPESPKAFTPKKDKAKKVGKDGKKEKTFTKTYVRADHYDGEHVAYTWEKPDWTKTQLRSTGKGDEVRKGGNLANPITFPKKKPANAELAEEEEYEQINKEELMRRLRNGDAGAAASMIPLPAYRGGQRKLRFSIHGAKIRDGGDIVKPITKATVYRKPEDVNHLAKPENLRSTAEGSKVRQGGNLAAPVTKATVIKRYEWEKPSWARRTESAVDPSTLERPITHIPKDEERDVNKHAHSGLLKPTPQGSTLRNGSEPAIEKKKYEWAKPEWTKPKVRATGKGQAVKAGASLANPVTFPLGQGDGINKEVQPDAVLRQTEKGQVVKQGETLARPITQLPELSRNQEAVQ